MARTVVKVHRYYGLSRDKDGQLVLRHGRMRDQQHDGAAAIETTAPFWRSQLRILNCGFASFIKTKMRQRFPRPKARKSSARRIFRPQVYVRMLYRRKCNLDDQVGRDAAPRCATAAFYADCERLDSRRDAE